MLTLQKEMRCQCANPPSYLMLSEYDHCGCKKELVKGAVKGTLFDIGIVSIVDALISCQLAGGINEIVARRELLDNSLNVIVNVGLDDCS